MSAGGGSYSVKRSLEQYAGKTIDLYLVAEADDTGYANSPNGIVYTMTVPERLPAPRVKWAYGWEMPRPTRSRRPISETAA